MELNDLSPFAIPNVDVKSGDIIIIKDEGERKTLQNGNIVYTFGVELPDESTRKLSINKTSRTALAVEWGKETKSWCGKKVKVEIKEQNVAGKDKLVIYLTPIKDDNVID